MNPADPEHFRTTYRNQRWYVDPLPGCELADATAERWPSVTTVKRVWAGEFRKKLDTGEVVNLDAYRAASFALDNLDTVTALDRDAALSLICTQPGRDLNAAANRGTDIHTAIEDLCAGREPDTLLNPDAVPFLPAARKAVTSLDLDIVQAEAVVIHRGHELLGGYGGTFDALAHVTIDGTRGLYIVDWKTRTSKHGAYLEEAAQLAAYAFADYMVIDEDGRAVRVPVPDIDGGLVVSICSDGTFAVYPVDLDYGRTCFMHMRQAWDLKRDGQSAGRKAIGDPIHPDNLAGQPTCGTADPLAAETSAWLLERVEHIKTAGHAADLAACWPAGVATPKAVRDGAVWSDDDLDAVRVAVAHVQSVHRMDFDTVGTDPRTPTVEARTPAPAVDPELSELVDDDRKAAFRRRVAALDEALVAEVLDAARKVGVPRLATNVTVRQMMACEEALARAEAAQIARRSGDAA